jgi:hypothetical protein
MKKGCFSIALMLALIIGCATMEPMSVREEKYGKNPPVIHKIYASPEFSRHENWKIYLKGSDPDGDLKSVVAVSTRGDISPMVSKMELPEGNRKEFSGYLLWHPGNLAQDFMKGEFTIQLQDMAGHYSNELKVSFTLISSAVQRPPSSGEFEDKQIGIIMSEFKDIPGHKM